MEVPVGAVCQRCKDKIEWRKKYDKYKPLSTPSRCDKCLEKTVKHAYHKICLPCGEKLGVCTMCSTEGETEAMPLTAAEERKLDIEYAEKIKGMRERERRTFFRKQEAEDRVERQAVAQAQLDARGLGVGGLPRREGYDTRHRQPVPGEEAGSNAIVGVSASAAGSGAGAGAGACGADEGAEKDLGAAAAASNDWEAEVSSDEEEEEEAVNVVSVAPPVPAPTPAANAVAADVATADVATADVAAADVAAADVATADVATADVAAPAE